MPVNLRKTVATIDSPLERSPHFRRVRVAISSRFDVEVGCIEQWCRKCLRLRHSAGGNGNWGVWGFDGQIR